LLYRLIFPHLSSNRMAKSGWKKSPLHLKLMVDGAGLSWWSSRAALRLDIDSVIPGSSRRGAEPSLSRTLFRQNCIRLANFAYSNKNVCKLTSCALFIVQISFRLISVISSMTRMQRFYPFHVERDGRPNTAYTGVSML
jgi:hypothetical protein